MEYVDRIRQAGKLAKVKQYRDYIERITKGDKALSPSELKHFNKLDAELEAEAKDTGQARSKRVVANDKLASEYCGISKRTLHYHIKKGNIRQNTDGTFNVTDLDSYLAKYNRKRSKDKLESIEARQKKADLRYRLARAELNEFLVRQQKGEFLKKEEVVKEWTARVRLVNNGLDLLVERLAPLLEMQPRESIAQVLQLEIDELKRLYAANGKYCPTDS